MKRGMKRGMKRVVFLLSLIAVSCAIFSAIFLGCSDSDKTTVLRVALPPGRIADFERVVVPGFVALTGVTIESIGMRSADQVARLRIEREHPSVDVFCGSTTEKHNFSHRRGSSRN